MHRPKRDMSFEAVFHHMKSRWERTKARHFSHKKTSGEGRGRRK